jgi:hypothetical protein
MNHCTVYARCTVAGIARRRLALLARYSSSSFELTVRTFSGISDSGLPSTRNSCKESSRRVPTFAEIPTIRERSSKYDRSKRRLIEEEMKKQWQVRERQRVQESSRERREREREERVKRERKPTWNIVVFQVQEEELGEVRCSHGVWELCKEVVGKRKLFQGETCVQFQRRNWICTNNIPRNRLRVLEGEEDGEEEEERERKKNQAWRGEQEKAVQWREKQQNGVHTILNHVVA